MGATLVLATPLDAAAPVVPTFVPRLGPVEYEVVVTTRDGEVLGALRNAVALSISDMLNGVGEHVFSWAPRLEDEPGAGLLIEDGRLITWADADVEVAVFRSGALAAVGPVISHAWENGRVRTTCWSREGYLNRLVNGGAGRLNLFGAGDWDNGFHWTEQNEVSASLSGATPLWRTDEVLELSQGGGRQDGVARETLTLPAVNRNNRVHISIPAMWTDGSGWGGSGDPAVARIVHSTVDDVGVRTRRGVKWLALDHGAGPDSWHKLEESFPEIANVRNEYAFSLYAPQDGTGRIGEVEVVRNENVSARDGWDKATLIAALYDDVRPRLPGGETAWNRSVDPTGEILTLSVRYDDADHADVVSILRDWEENGVWWIPLGTRLLRWAPTRGSQEPVMVLTRDNSAGLTLAVDGGDCETEVVTLADGQTGPTREEGGADAGTDLHLMGVHQAPRGLQPRMLNDHAGELLDEFVRPSVKVSGNPAFGPGPITLPGDWWHRTQPGDRVRCRVTDGLLDMVVDCQIESRTLDCQSDLMTPTLSEAMP